MSDTNLQFLSNSEEAQTFPKQEPEKTQQNSQEAPKHQPQQEGIVVDEKEKLVEEPKPLPTFQDLINRAIQLKNEGNKKFKEKDLISAIQFYSDALRILDPNNFKGATPAQLRKMADLSATLLFNIGASYFNGYDFVKAQIFCNEALILNPNYIKALHKRALARLSLRKIEEAFSDIKVAFSLDKTNAEIHKSYSIILEEYNLVKKKEQEEMKQMSGKIFKSESQKSQNNSQKQQQQVQKKKKQSESGISTYNMVTGAAIVGLIGWSVYKWIK